VGRGEGGGGSGGARGGSRSPRLGQVRVLGRAPWRAWAPPHPSPFPRRPPSRRRLLPRPLGRLQPAVPGRHLHDQVGPTTGPWESAPSSQRRLGLLPLQGDRAPQLLPAALLDFLPASTALNPGCPCCAHAPPGNYRGLRKRHCGALRRQPWGVSGQQQCGNARAREGPRKAGALGVPRHDVTKRRAARRWVLEGCGRVWRGSPSQPILPPHPPSCNRVCRHYQLLHLGQARRPAMSARLKKPVLTTPSAHVYVSNGPWGRQGLRLTVVSAIAPSTPLHARPTFGSQPFSLAAFR
jgi:hypothetical protein